MLSCTPHEDPFEPSDDETRLDHAINRILTPQPPAPERRSMAIFRVVASAAGFEFTRTVSDPCGAENETTERFGPYGTQRAAHELAQRAAARFRLQYPQHIVGVVDIDPAPASAPQRQLRDEIRERRVDKRRKLQRNRYARVVATPEGRQRLRERGRVHSNPTGAPKVCTDERDGVFPTCAWCGSPTGFYHGRPLKFCARAADQKYSRCNMRYTNSLYAQAVKDDPGINQERASKQRKCREGNPDKARERYRRARQALRNDPKRWAAKLAVGREYKARRRAQERAERPNTDRPSGSVLLTSAPGVPGRDLLASVYAEVSSKLPPHLRMEIISEAVLLHLEGADLKLAVSQARKNVNKGASLLRYAKPIDDCFWLADESAFNPGANP